MLQEIVLNLFPVMAENTFYPRSIISMYGNMGYGDILVGVPTHFAKLAHLHIIHCVGLLISAAYMRAYNTHVCKHQCVMQ